MPLTNPDVITISRPPAIFREAALRRHSSPEQLDHFLAVSSPANWLILAAALLIFTAVGAWSWTGSITRTASGDGILIGSAGVVSVNTPGGGQVLDVSVKPGDLVRANQVIARIGNPLLAEQVRLAEMALADAEREAERNVQMRSATARLQTDVNDSQRRNLEREITELENQTVFAAEQARIKQILFDEGLTLKTNLVAAQEKVVEIRADIARHRTQLSQLQVDRFTAQTAVANASAQARERIGDLGRRVTELREELSHATSAITPSAGRVIETKVYAGAMVNAGAPLATIQPADGALEALIYVASKEAKHVVAGMEVQLSPSGTRPEEQGYLLGTILTVATYPVSQLAVLRKLENETLANAITGQGPVTEVRVALRRGAPGNGYEWSAHHGQRPTLSGGTLCGARIVIGRQRPVSLAAPLMKEALGLN